MCSPVKAGGLPLVIRYRLPLTELCIGKEGHAVIKDSQINEKVPVDSSELFFRRHGRSELPDMLSYSA